MALHFERAEYQARIARVLSALEHAGLDGLLMFQQESMYYLTGYDTFGFCFFQCLYLGADGRLALLTRSADLRQARHTSIIEDVRVWTDARGASPAGQLRDMLEGLGLSGRRLGFEARSHGLTHADGRAVDALADLASDINERVENIGARRLQTVMEKLLEEVSFDAEDRQGQKLTVDAAYVDKQLASIARNTDLSRFVL